MPPPVRSVSRFSDVDQQPRRVSRPVASRIAVAAMRQASPMKPPATAIMMMAAITPCPVEKASVTRVTNSGTVPTRISGDSGDASHTQPAKTSPAAPNSMSPAAVSRTGDPVAARKRSNAIRAAI